MTISVSSQIDSAKTPPSTPAMEQLDRLFAGLYQSTGSGSMVTDEQLASFLRGHTCVDGAVRAVREAFPSAALPPRQQGMMAMAESILADYFMQPVFHPQLRESLQGACGGLLASALAADGWLVRRRHPAGKLLARVAQVAAGWDPVHPRAEHIRKALEAWLTQASNRAGAEKAALRADEWISRFHAHRQRITARVREAESGLVEIRYVRELAARALNRQVADRTLPEFMAESLSREWISAFQWVLLHEGENSVLWQRLNRCFGLLVWSLQPEAGHPEQREKLKRVLGRLRNELRDVLETVVRDDTERNVLLDSIQVAHLCQLHGLSRETVQAPLVDGGGGFIDESAEVGRNIPDEMDSVRVGQWYHVSAAGERVQLLVRDDQCQQLVFVNQAGMRAFDASFGEFARQLDCGDILTVPEPQPLVQWVSDSVETLFGAWCARRGEPLNSVRSCQENFSPASGCAAILQR